MFVNFFDTGNILRRDDLGLSALLIGDNTAEMNNAIDHNDADPEGSPVSLIQRRDDMVAK
jgi:hypothetical protein